MSRMLQTTRGIPLCTSQASQRFDDRQLHRIDTDEHLDTEPGDYSTDKFEGLPKCFVSSPKLISHLNCNSDSEEPSNDLSDQEASQNLLAQKTGCFREKFTTRTLRMDSPQKASIHVHTEHNNRSVFTFQERPCTTVSFGGDRCAVLKAKHLCKPNLRAVSERPVAKMLTDETLDPS